MAKLLAADCPENGIYSGPNARIKYMKLSLYKLTLAWEFIQSKLLSCALTLGCVFPWESCIPVCWSCECSFDPIDSRMLSYWLPQSVEKPGIVVRECKSTSGHVRVLGYIEQQSTRRLCRRHWSWHSLTALLRIFFIFMLDVRYLQVSCARLGTCGWWTNGMSTSNYCQSDQCTIIRSPSVKRPASPMLSFAKRKRKLICY